MKKGFKHLGKGTSLLLCLLVLVIGFSLVSAQTYRLGGDSLTFSPSNVVSKTAAYTVTSSDSEIQVDASSAAVTITLPTVASATTGGTKSYKIKKTDNSVNAVTVTPATGDTIGGEATRGLTSQNDYVVLSTSSNNNWKVSFESPLLAEDYSTGTINIPTSIAADSSTLKGSPIVVIGQSGVTTSQAGFASSDVTGSSITLPASWVAKGKALKWTVAGTKTASNAAMAVYLYVLDGTVMTLTSSTTSASDWKAEFYLLENAATSSQSVVGCLYVNDQNPQCDHATASKDVSGSTTAKVIIEAKHASDTVTTNYVLVEHWKK